jgi:hypothetical protein
MTPTPANSAPLPAADAAGAKHTAPAGGIDTLLEGIEQTRERVQASLPGNPAPALGVQAVEPAATTPEADALHAIESLDARLAELTAELLGGSPDSAEPAPAAAAALEPPPLTSHAVTHPPPDRPGLEPLSFSLPAMPVTHIREAPAPLAPPVATPPSPAPVAAPAPPMPAPQPVPPPPTTKAPTKPSLLLRAATAVSSPLAERPAAVRSAIGWLAIYTLALAAGLWAYIALRSPPPPPASFNLESSSLPQPPAPKASKPAKAEPPKSDATATPTGH